MNLILIEPHEVQPAGLVQLADDRARHIHGVLRATPGKPLKVGLLNGPRGQAIVQECSSTGVTLACSFEGEPPPGPRVDLLLALPRPKVLGRLWSPLAQLGVRRLMLTNGAKVERNYFDTHWLKPEVYRPLLVEGLQQACDTRLPTVSVHRFFRPLVEDHLSTDPLVEMKLVADPSATVRLSGVSPPRTGAVMLAVGPEGGWTPFELDLLGKAGFSTVHVGSRILRTDTACVALLALLQDRLEGSVV